MAIPPRITLPNTPALAVGLSAAGWLDSTGEIEELSFEDTAQRLKDGIRPLLCHGPGTADRLSLKRFQCFDVLELFAFVRPLNFCVPTPRGLGDALQIDVGPRPADAALGLVQATQALLNELADTDQVDARPIAWAMARGGWSWGPSVLAALGEEAAGRARSAGAGSYGFGKLVGRVVDLALAAPGRASRLRGRPHAARAAARGLLRRQPLADERAPPRAHRRRRPRKRSADCRRRAAPDGADLLLGLPLHARPRLHRLTLPL